MYSCNWTEADLRLKKLLLSSMRMNNATKGLMLRASPTKIIDLQLFANVSNCLHLLIALKLNFNYNMVLSLH